VSDELLIHVRHLRAAGMCNREPRLWFKRHGLSWTEFVTTGIPASRILATSDSLAYPVVEIARKEAANVNR
jgi:hypothetical protein